MNFSNCLMSYFLTILSAILFSSTSTLAQVETGNTLLIEEQLEQNADALEAEADLSELTETMFHFLEHPLNINKATDYELRESGLFTEFQIVHLLDHIVKFGTLIVINELQVINGFDENFIRRILPYITTGKLLDDPNASFGRMVKEGKHQVMLRAQLIPEEKRGFNKDSGPPKYPGNPYSLYARYRFTFMKKMSWGITAEKDAGEQFFAGAQKNGFDFYSGHFALRDIGPFRIIALGDFQLEYGQGLTLWTSLSGGKSSDPVSVKKNAQGIRPYTSSNEVFFKRGAAVSLQKKRVRLDVFLSRKKMDATLNTSVDTLTTEDIFTSFQQSGFHRTESEIAGKNSISELMFGGHFRYVTKTFQTGVTGHRTVYNTPLMKSVKSYNQFEFSGMSISNFGWDYSLLYRNFNFFGETTIDEQFTVSTVHGVILSADPRLALSAVFRNYPVKFQTMYGSAFRESGKNYNERGIYAGFVFRPFSSVSTSLYYDRFYFPWLRYRVDAPSYGNELNFQIRYTPARRTELYLRFKRSSKMQNSGLEGLIAKVPVNVLQNGIRLHLTTKVSKLFTLRSRVEMVNYKKDFRHDRGFMIYQDVQYHPMGKPFSCNFRFALFDTDNYDSRIYAYENDVLYGYSIPAYNYKGTRFYFNARYKIRKGVDAWFRYAATFYSNRNVIGSGWEEIQGNRKSDLKIQFRFEF